MKNLYFTTLLFFIISFKVFCQNPSVVWARSAGGPGLDYIREIVTDNSGNIYAIGDFDSTSISFDNIQLFNDLERDAFVVKYSADGNIVWAKNIFGNSDINKVFGLDLTIDTDGNLYVIGNFSSDSLTVGNIKLANRGGTDLFLANIDNNGSVVWAKSAGGEGHDYGNGIEVDNNNSVYITGSFVSDSINFDSNILLNPNTFSYIFLVKYDENGNVIWAKKEGGDNSSSGLELEINLNDEIILTGQFLSTLTVGSYNLVSEGGTDILTAKYDSNGNIIWAKSMGSYNSDAALDLASDASGNVIVVGEFSFAPYFVYSEDTLFCNSGFCSYTIKIDSSGNYLWGKSVSGSTTYNAEVDQNRNIFIWGSYVTPTISFGNINLTNNGVAHDMFLVKYDENGEEIWGKGFGGEVSDYASGLKLDSDGNIIIAGVFQSTNLNIEAFSFVNIGMNDIFIAKLVEQTNNIETNQFDNSLCIYPNPLSKNEFLQLNRDLLNGKVLIDNMLGQNMLEINGFNGHEINLTEKNLSNGLYQIKLFENNRLIFNYKLIIEE